MNSNKGRLVFIGGVNLDLVVVNKDRHIEDCLRYLNDQEISRWMLVGLFPVTIEQELAWFEQASAKNENNIIFAMELKSGKFLGMIGLHRIDWVSRTAESGIWIGDKNEWSKGYATEAGKLLHRYAFLGLGLNKIYARIFSGNTASLKSAKKKGFQEEGRLKNHIYKNGKLNDIVMVSLFKEDFVN